MQHHKLEISFLPLFFRDLLSNFKLIHSDLILTCIKLLKEKKTTPTSSISVLSLSSFSLPPLRRISYIKNKVKIHNTQEFSNFTRVCVAKLHSTKSAARASNLREVRCLYLLEASAELSALVQH